jgi:MarR family transcriptional regulator, lower aerobic nicotinate degradation pathway regulator
MRTMSKYGAVMPAAADPDDDLRFTDALVQLSFAVQGILAEAGAREGLSLPQLRLLGILRDRELKMQQIATFLGLEKSSVTGLVDRAERRGLLARGTSDDDGRAVTVTLSTDGQRVARRVRAAVTRGLKELASRLTEAQQQRLTRTAEQLLGDHG